MKASYSFKKIKTVNSIKRTKISRLNFNHLCTFIDELVEGLNKLEVCFESRASLILIYYNNLYEYNFVLVLTKVRMR